MPKFIKLKSGNFLNLDVISFVQEKDHKVWTIEDACAKEFNNYTVADDTVWEIIMKYVNDHLYSSNDAEAL